jgi:glyoxylase-like metal-dependent hydrolase (beta-lactamase superfamily II)
MIRFIFLLFTALLTLNAFAKPSNLSLEREEAFLGAKVSIYKEVQGLKVHRFITSFVYSYLLETKNSVVIIDTLTDLEAGKKLLSYAQSLKKPIYGVFITHTHGDHIGGIEAFKGYGIYSFEGVLNEIRKKTKSTLKLVEISEDKELEIGGIKYIPKNIKEAHIQNHLILLMPDIEGIIVGDLAIANFKTHRLLIRNFDAFIEGLTFLKNQKGYSFLLGGHGDVIPFSKLNDNINFVKIAKKSYLKAKNVDDYFAIMSKKYQTIKHYDNLQRRFFEENGTTFKHND